CGTGDLRVRGAEPAAHAQEAVVMPKSRDGTQRRCVVPVPGEPRPFGRYVLQQDLWVTVHPARWSQPPQWCFDDASRGKNSRYCDQALFDSDAFNITLECHKQVQRQVLNMRTSHR